MMMSNRSNNSYWV